MDEPNVPLNKHIDLINQNDPSITNFKLKYPEGRRMTKDQIRALFRGMLQNTHVRKLNLCWTPQELRHTVCQQLLPPLLRENSSIQDLRFPEYMTNAEFEPTEDVLRNNNTTVKTLYLVRCDIRGHDGGEMIGRLITNSHHIMTINLYRNENLGPAGASQIAAALGNENCALKTLYLNLCGIGDEGVDALCTGLQANNLLEKIEVLHNGITEEGYRALASSLPNMRVLKEIRFAWEQRQVSTACLRQMMEGLRTNQSLQCIAVGVGNFPEEQRREWVTFCAFVGARNKMKCHLDEVRIVAAREGRVTPMPVLMAHLLHWCHRPSPPLWHREDVEVVQDSLAYLVLRSNVGKIAGWEH